MQRYYNIFPVLLCLAGLLAIVPFVPGVRLNFKFVYINLAVIAFAGLIAIRINPWVGLFLVVAVFSAHYPYTSKESRETLFYILIGMIWFYCLSYVKNEERIYTGMRIAVILHLVFLGLQAFDLDFTKAPKYEALITGFSGDPPVGILSAPAEASAFIAIGFIVFAKLPSRLIKLPLFWNASAVHRNDLSLLRNRLPLIRKVLPLFWNDIGKISYGRWFVWIEYRNKIKLSWLMFIPLLIWGLWQTSTFTGPLAVGASAMLVFFIYFDIAWQFKLMVLGMVAFMVFLYAVICDVPDIAWRYQTWKRALFQIWPLRPVSGHGLGHWKVIHSHPILTVFTDGKAMTKAHFDTLQALIEMGLPFVVCFAGYFLQLRRQLRKIDPKIVFGICSAFIVSCTFFVMHNPLTALMVISWLAAKEIQVRQL